MTRVTLVRHGETEHNRSRLTLGRADVPLNGRGRLQARALAASFVRAPAAMSSSPLARCRDTADSIAQATSVAVTIEPDLIEMDVGEMEHLTRDELSVQYPEFLRHWFGADVADARMPGGETLGEVQDRAWAALERIRTAHEGGEVVVFTHNFVILTLVCRALGLPLAQFRRLRTSLASKAILDMTDGGTTLISCNDTAHLKARGLG